MIYLFIALFFLKQSILVESCTECHEIVSAGIQDAISLQIKHLKETIDSLSNIQNSLDGCFEASGNMNGGGGGMGTSESHPAESCEKLMKYGRKSGEYYIKPAGASTATKMYCNMDLECGGVKGGWMRVANIDMKDTKQSCPNGGFKLITSPRRLCQITSSGCLSTKFSVNNMPYSRVCGRIIAYQFTTPIAFHYRGNGFEKAYVHGISLTHGGAGSRRHIWTFAGASDETTGSPSFKCKCINSQVAHKAYAPPSVVGNDYFCDTANYKSYGRSGVLTDDPLWDGKGCGSYNKCCTQFPSTSVHPPWFYKPLSSSTTDDIEMRLCRPDSSGSTPFEIVEIYVRPA